MDEKLELLEAHFGSQRSKDWYDAESSAALMRLRGMECRSPSGYAEAFTAAEAAVCGRTASLGSRGVVYARTID